MLGVIKTSLVLEKIFSETQDLISVYSTEDFTFSNPNPTFILQSYTSINSPSVMRALMEHYGQSFKIYSVLGDWSPILNGKIPIWRDGKWLIDL